jgi:hypothetical protein
MPRWRWWTSYVEEEVRSSRQPGFSSKILCQAHGNTLRTSETTAPRTKALGGEALGGSFPALCSADRGFSAKQNLILNHGS